ncbi:helix-turn-helix domain-containing protein [Paenibacillus alvei]|uniref:Putative transcriptional regulator n=1 Tax=Paenibacillus alvei TaxID=44250 RepID=A0A383RLI0_PAEAL|nr:helix-turn-helix transcriptional regulator [Paenibacillus alvei]SYX85880.1 putative transcriptional regulator [Paenibacillus alvei]SYX87703.1 putative transcriptional regulator [Paenibacillus alvei]
MIRLIIDKKLKELGWSNYKLHQLTGIRPNTINDLVDNKSKAWSPENLTKIYKALNLDSMDELFEHVEEEPKE